MGDNIKKVANLFVISDFCSIFAFGLIRPRVMTSVFVDEIIAFAVYSINVQETWRWKECIHE